MKGKVVGNFSNALVATNALYMPCKMGCSLMFNKKISFLLNHFSLDSLNLCWSTSAFPDKSSLLLFILIELPYSSSVISWFSHSHTDWMWFSLLLLFFSCVAVVGICSSFLINTLTQASGFFMAINMNNNQNRTKPDSSLELTLVQQSHLLTLRYM